MNILFRLFAKRIIVDVHPLHFTFTCSKPSLNFSIASYVYVDNAGPQPKLIAIGEEISHSRLMEPSIYRINIFDLQEPLPPDATFSRDQLIQVLFEYGIGKIFSRDLLPPLRPIVFIMGADRFQNHFLDPRDKFMVAAKLGGAKEVIFDKTDI